MKITFKKEIDYDNPHDLTEIEMKINTLTVSRLVEEFECFLKGCGFVFDGKLDFVEDEE